MKIFMYAFFVSLLHNNNFHYYLNIIKVINKNDREIFANVDIFCNFCIMGYVYAVLYIKIIPEIHNNIC